MTRKELLQLYRSGNSIYFRQLNSICSQLTNTELTTIIEQSEYIGGVNEYSFRCFLKTFLK